MSTVKKYFFIILRRIIFYSILLFILFLIGTNCLYFPTPYEDELADYYEDIYFESGDSMVYGRYIEAKNGLPTIIFSHGNGGNVANYFPIVYEISQMTGCGVLIYDYRGYGKSKGFAWEKNTYTDLRNAIKYANKIKRIPNDNIILWGVSLGGAVTAQIATEQNFKAVILQNTFTNIRDMAQYKIVQAFFLNTNNKFIRESIFRLIYYLPILQPFDTKNKISKINSPLLIIHSTKDDLIPFAMSEINAANNKNAKLIISDFGQHNDFYYSLETIAQYITEL